MLDNPSFGFMGDEETHKKYELTGKLKIIAAPSRVARSEIASRR